MLPLEVMAKAAAPRARWARALAIVAAGLLGAVSGSCADSRSSLGERCLTDEDCLSGICAQQLCASASPIQDGSTNGVAAPQEDSPAGASTDTGPSSDSPVDVLADAAADQSASDAGRETGVDATADVADAAPEALSDAATDAPAEAPADAAADAPADGSSVDSQIDSSADGAEGG
jgi:hypothetical protein